MLPESRTAAAPRSSRALRPWRSMLVTSSSTKRAPGWCSWRSRTSSIRETVCTTRRWRSAGTSSAAPNGRHGVITSRSPGNRPATSGSSEYVPTARVSQPSHAALRASRPSPKPYPLPFATGTRPGLGLGDRPQVRAPAVPVDREGEAHVARRLMASWKPL